jgi:ribosomal protein L12E/L44/L45/RPP1/RPP2
MGEQVLATAVRSDETKALAIIEPLDGASLRSHVKTIQSKNSCAAHAIAVQSHARKSPARDFSQRPRRDP